MMLGFGPGRPFGPISEPRVRVTLPLVFTALIFIALPGCSMLRSGQTQQVLDGYIGHSLSEVGDRFGPPQSNFPQIDNGEISFEWNNFSLDRPPGAPAGGPPTSCRVWISALPAYPGANPAFLGSWIVQSSQSFGCR